MTRSLTGLGRRDVLRLAGTGLALSAMPFRAFAFQISPELLTPRMADFMAREIAAGTLMGGVLLVEKDGKTVLHQAYGHTDAAASRPSTTQDLFRIASMTKPVTSVAIMSFVEEGRIALDEPVATYLPELAGLKVRDEAGQPAPLTQQPTVYDLLRQAGGFTYAMFGAADEAIRSQYGEADLEQIRSDMSSTEMLTRLAKIPLAFPPDRRFEYSIGIDLLGFILERVSGQPLSQVLAERIFTPLGMTQTSFAVTEKDAERLAQVSHGDRMKPFTEGWMRVEKPRGEAYLSGGGGLVSTAQDYLQFCRMILNEGALNGKRVLSPATVRLMTSDHAQRLEGGPEIFTGPGYGFGLGFAVRRANGEAYVEGNRGDVNWSGFNGTTFTIDPEEKLIAIFMAAAPTARNHLRFAFRNVTYGALVGEAADG